MEFGVCSDHKCFSVILDNAGTQQGAFGPSPESEPLDFPPYAVLMPEWKSFRM